MCMTATGSHAGIWLKPSMCVKYNQISAETAVCFIAALILMHRVCTVVRKKLGEKMDDACANYFHFCMHDVMPHIELGPPGGAT